MMDLLIFFYKDDFFDCLKGFECSNVKVYAITKGLVVFPKIPLMRVEGPLDVVQLLEIPYVNLICYASIVTRNAARHRFVLGKSKLLEFGLTRAQVITFYPLCIYSNCAAGNRFVGHIHMLLLAHSWFVIDNHFVSMSVFLNHNK